MVCGTPAKTDWLLHPAALLHTHSSPLTLAHSRMSKKSKCLFFWIFSNSRSSLRDSFRSWITLSGEERVKGSARAGDAELQNCPSNAKLTQGGEHRSVHDAFDMCASASQAVWLFQQHSNKCRAHCHPFLQTSLSTTDSSAYFTHPSCIKIMPGLERKIIPCISVACSAHPLSYQSLVV